MTDSLLQQAMHPDTLDSSWRRLRSEHTPWSVSTDRDQLAQHTIRHLLECRDQVLSGVYRPEPLRQFTMKKPDGRQRVLSAQHLKDKWLQRALLIVLEPRAEALFHNDSYAYRPARGVEQAIGKVRERVRVGMDWLVDTDIQSFFDAIPHKPLIKVLESFIKDRATMKLIRQWLQQGCHRTSLLGTRRGISQGAILSPLFCNLYLHSFDQSLSRQNIPFVRYADDFLLFADTKANAGAALDFARIEIENLALQLHPKKTRCVRSGPEVVFLGKPLPHPSR